MRKFEVELDEGKCKGCLICVYICNYKGGKALKESDKRTSLGGSFPKVKEECIGCRWCEKYCPDFALSIEEVNVDV